MVKASTGTLRDAVADRLREDIITGALRPGELIRDQEIAQRYSASTSPVREAIVQLAAERLIEAPTNRVKRVAPLDRKTSQDLFDVILLLSLRGYELGVPLLSDAAIETLRANVEAQGAALAAGEQRRVVKLLWAFHDPVYIAAGNAQLHRIISDSYPWMQRLATLLPMGLPRKVDRALALLEPIERRDAAGATAVMRDWSKEFQTLIDRLPDV